MVTTTGITVTIINPTVTSVAANTVGIIPVLSSTLTTAFLQSTAETNAKLDRIVTIVTASQVVTRQLIEELHAAFKKDQKETAEKPSKQASLSAEVVFRRKGDEKQFHISEAVQEQIHVAETRVQEASTSSTPNSFLWHYNKQARHWRKVTVYLSLDRSK